MSKRSKKSSPPAIVYPLVDSAKPVLPKRRTNCEFTEQRAEEICSRMAAGETLPQICRDAHMPSPNVVRYTWTEKYPAFSDAYIRARHALVDHWAEETIDIADDSTNDYVDREVRAGRAVRVVDQEHIARARLRVDARRWLVSKLNPKSYGDRVDLNVGGQAGNPLAVVGATMSAADAAQAYAQLVQGRTTEVDGGSS